MPEGGDQTPLSSSTGFHIEHIGSELHIRLDADILSVDERQDWAAFLIRSCSAFDSAPQSVHIDIGALPILASTVIGALIKLADHFRQSGSTQIHLCRCADRVKRTLQMMKIDSLFQID